MKSGHRKRAPEEIRLTALNWAAASEPRLVARLADRFAISRQGAHKHVKNLVSEGLLIPQGTNRWRTYSLAVLESKDETFDLAGLEEHAVWRSCAAPLMESAPGPVNELAHFAFTEMVNNAIDHSEGSRLSVEVTRTPLWVQMTIDDDGVGIFRKIRQALKLDDERHAMLELTKGKFTTDPKAHSGMGIFFTSRACDSFGILSGSIYFGHTRSGGDWLMDDRKLTGSGTIVRMEIDLDTPKRLNKVFDEGSAANSRGFTRTIIPVAVAQYGDENLISRSQAKRILARVEKFQEVLFDFKGVPIIGQAFADEIFRVFATEHPHVAFSSIHANDQVQAMIELAKENRGL